FSGQAGHPPLISTAYRDAILSWHGCGGLNGLLTQYAADSALIETGDEGILRDMDTPEAYERMLKLLHKETIPTRQACEQILVERFTADSPVVEHCRAVAHLAHTLAIRLNE